MAPGGGLPVTCLAIGVWMALSTSMIIFNADLLSSFRHPVVLTCWHMFASSLLIVVCRLIMPSAFATGNPEANVPPLTVWSAISLGVPVAVSQTVGLATSNAAIMYITVSFAQMIKAWTSASVYIGACLMGLQTFSVPVAKTIAVTTFGLMFAAVGELQFSMVGFVLQLVALTSEAVRINLLEIRLKSRGYRLNPLSSMQIFAPINFMLLLLAAIFLDRGGFNPATVDAVGVGVFVLNALLAFTLNISIFLVIQRASGLTFALCGVLKDILIILGSTVVFGSPVTTTQVAGYVLAVAGVQAYMEVSKAPADFEEKGVVPVLWQRFFERFADTKSLPAQPPPELSRDPSDGKTLELSMEAGLSKQISGASLDKEAPVAPAELGRPRTPA